MYNHFKNLFQKKNWTKFLIVIYNNKRKSIRFNKFLLKIKFFLYQIYINILYYNEFFIKKWLYTVNHKRIALNYLFFSFITVLSGTSLATMIRMELSTPGSSFFQGDSTRYL